jgi:hypothetical protein
VRLWTRSKCLRVECNGGLQRTPQLALFSRTLLRCAVELLHSSVPSGPNVTGPETFQQADVAFTVVTSRQFRVMQAVKVTLI